MHRESVESDALRGVGYDVDRRILEIEFTNGSIYRYSGIPEFVYAGLMTAASHGEFFAEHIRHAGYDYEQIA